MSVKSGEELPLRFCVSKGFAGRKGTGECLKLLLKRKNSSIKNIGAGRMTVEKPIGRIGNRWIDGKEKKVYNKNHELNESQ